MNKFEDIIPLEEGWEIETEDGFTPIELISKTVPYDIWEIKTENFELKCADDHKLFDKNWNPIFVKDCKINDEIQTINGLEKVIYVNNTQVMDNMYDVTVMNDKHSFNSNGIISHNTTISVVFLLWYILFHKDKNCAILANKGRQAIEIMSRLQLAYSNLPKWIQVGVEEWNKGSIKLENGSKIIAAATSSDSVRGQSFSCVSGDTLVTIVDDYNNVWYIPIENVNEINNYNKNNIIIYRIKNNITNNVYLFVHESNNINDGYFGSGDDIIYDIEKYGIENFSKEILFME